MGIGVPQRIALVCVWFGKQQKVGKICMCTNIKFKEKGRFSNNINRCIYKFSLTLKVVSRAASVGFMFFIYIYKYILQLKNIKDFLC